MHFADVPHEHDVLAVVVVIVNGFPQYTQKSVYVWECLRQMFISLLLRLLLGGGFTVKWAARASDEACIPILNSIRNIGQSKANSADNVRYYDCRKHCWQSEPPRRDCV